MAADFPEEDPFRSAPDEAQADFERELEIRFARDRISDLAEEFLTTGIGFNALQAANGRTFVVAYIPGYVEGKPNPYADIPLAIETHVFAEHFEKDSPYPLTKVLKDYGGRYDLTSTHATVIDVSKPKPVAAGMLRIVEPGLEPGLHSFKDVHDLVVVEDPEENPWIEEIKAGYFEPGEAYDPVTAWQRLGEKVGVTLDLGRSVDIASHAAEAEYREKHGGADSTSMLFFHACLRHAIAHKWDNLLAIFDMKPFENVQGMGDPFDLYDGLQPHPYGGPGDTIPAFCKVERAIERIPAHDKGIGAIMVQGFGLEGLALTPDEYDPTYSNETLGLDAV